MDFFSVCTAESAISTCGCDFNSKSHKPNKPFKIRKFPYSDIVSATNGFSGDRFLGKGSHGSVYKAILDAGNLVAAVKRTKSPNPSSNFNHNHHSSQFPNNTPAENEIEILSTIRNPNIVNLIGFCADSTHKLIVVEFMPNGSLYDLLHSRSRPPGWTRRIRFALQVANAVRSLHTSNPPVIHRDIKSSNVLIDGNFNARLGDFGLALRGHVEDVRVRCTPPAGTLGYLDPGYLAPADLSVKSDVFSFGILLLEIITGRNAIDVRHSPPSVVDWAVPMIKHGDFDGLCDPRIGSPNNPAVTRCLAVLAAKCVRSTVHKRPDMAEVVECLKVAKKPPMWINLRRRERHVENLQPLILNREEPDGNDEPVRGSRIGRRNRKVSSVSSTEYGIKTIGSINGRVVRSKSMGSMNDAKLGQINSNVGGNYYSALGGRRKYGGAPAKIPTMKLRKSRSLGVLDNTKLMEFNRRAAAEIEMSKLTIDSAGKSEKKMLLKPFFQIGLISNW